MELIAVLAAAILGIYFLRRRRSGSGVEVGSTREISGTLTTSVDQANDPDWVMPFVLFHIAWEMRTAGPGAMPKSVAALARGELDGPQHQQLAATLQSYLSYMFKRDYGPGDDESAIRGARDFLQAELRTLNTPLATKRYLRKKYKENNGIDVNDIELERQLSEISKDVRSNEDAGRTLRNILLADSVNELFQARHNKQIESFASDLSRHFATAS